MTDLDYNPTDPRWRADPYPIYRRLRDEAPVYRVPGTDLYCVSRYEDVRHVFKTAEEFPSVMGSSGIPQGRRRLGLWRMGKGLVSMYRMGINPLEARKSRMLIGANGKQHFDMRSVVNKGFTPARIALWEARAREIVAKSIEPIRNADRVELVHEFANPLPMGIIAEMLGVEPERQSDFKRWSDEVIQGTSGSADPASASAGMIEPWAKIHAYVRPLVKQRRADPKDDLISLIVSKENGPAALSEFEVAMFIALLLIAGNETTTNLIANTVHALYDHPDQLELVRQRPELIPALVEEMLRFDCPVQLLFRGSSGDTELSGTRIPAGARVVAMIGSANRDERQFEDPDRLNVERDASGHLGLGMGAHFCLGSTLARLEARCALEALIPELPRFEREGPREFVESMIIRGAPRLQLRALAG
jgi:cytochrome P450